MTFADRKLLDSYRKACILVHDQQLGCYRVTAFTSSIEMAKDLASRPRLVHVGIYVRHDDPLPPIAGDYQI